MGIEIHYLVRGESGPRVLVLSAEEYFDPVEETESYERDGIPRFNHAEDYFRLPVTQLSWSEIRVTGTSDDRTIRTEYARTGKATMIHRVDPDGFELMIHFTQLTASSCHIIRTWKRGPGAWSVCLDSLIEDLPDGSQRETRFDIDDPRDGTVAP